MSLTTMLYQALENIIRPMEMIKNNITSNITFVMRKEIMILIWILKTKLFDFSFEY